jgi:hypothetical protein
MNTKIFIANKCIIIICLIIHTHVWSMINITMEHNHENISIALPKECFNLIIANSIDTTKPFVEVIESALLLPTTCKACNNHEILITMGKICKKYDIKEKKDAMRMLLKKINDINYKHKRHAALLLTYAGAKNDANKYSSLLNNVVHHYDKQMLTALFDNNANPNQRNILRSSPIFFDVQTIEIAQMFINNGVNLHAKGNDLIPHVLWACLAYGHSVELIEFYLGHKVDTRCIDTSILHALATYMLSQRSNIDRYIRIVQLLLKADPDMINMLDNYKKTPLDCAKIGMKRPTIYKESYELYQALIELFEQHGGKTAKQLKQNVTQQNTVVQQPTVNNRRCVCYDLCESSNKTDQLPALEKIWHT